MTLRRLGILLPTTLIAFPALVHAAGGTGHFRAVYSQVENQDFAEIQTEMQKNHELEDIASNLDAVVSIPSDITVTYGECNEVNAFYDPEKHRMTICYELVQHLYDVFGADAKSDDDLDDAVAGAIDFVTYHELGHALVHVLDLPITGKEEDVADQLSTFLLADGTDEGEASVLEGAQWFLLEDKENDSDLDKLPFWDEHSLDKQRFYNVACWLYGHDQERYASLVEKGVLPEERAARCAGEYEQMANSWTRLLGSHLKQAPNEGE